MNIVILGCGVVGSLVARSMAGQDHWVLGARRHPSSTEIPGCPVLQGDIADPNFHSTLAHRMPDVDAYLLAANPGVRGGQDNGLARAAQWAIARHPRARFVYTATTSVYGDAGGAPVTEESPIDRRNANTAALMAIEDAVLEAGQAVILRATALVGPSRTFSRDKLQAAAKAGEPCIVRGDPERPFSYVHEQDLTDICVAALSGKIVPGIYNVASPDVLTLRSYYEAVAHEHGIECTLQSDGAHTPSRSIDASHLERAHNMPQWRTPV